MINVFDTALQVKRPSLTSLKAESMLSVEYVKYCRSITEHYNSSIVVFSNGATVFDVFDSCQEIVDINA